MRTDRLARENAALIEEVARTRASLEQLQDSVVEMSMHDEFVRLMAGLDPLDHAEFRAEAARAPEAGGIDAASAELDAVVEQVRRLTTSWEEAATSLRDKHARLAATPSILPAMGRLSSQFSRHRWHPILERARAHTGIDIGAPAGTPVLAAARGTVKFVGTRGQYGLLIEVDHGHGFVTRYAHLSRADVRAGDVVERWTQLGGVGETGLAIGPHLHYEVLVNGVHSNPLRFIYPAEAIPD